MISSHIISECSCPNMKGKWRRDAIIIYYYLYIYFLHLSISLFIHEVIHLFIYYLDTECGTRGTNCRCHDVYLRMGFVLRGRRWHKDPRKACGTENQRFVTSFAPFPFQPIYLSRFPLPINEEWTALGIQFAYLTLSASS